MSKLAAALAEAVAGAGQPRRCSVCDVLPKLPDGDREWLLKALASKLGAKRMAIILQDNGVEVGVPSIHLHRSERHQL